MMAPLREAGLAFHGLRKSAVVFLLEAFFFFFFFFFSRARWWSITHAR